MPDFNAISFFFSSRRRHTSSLRDWSSDVCSSDLDLERLRQRPIVLATVVFLSSRRLVGEGARRDEVPPPDLLGRLAKLEGDDVDQALKIVRGLWTPRAAVGGDRRRVGKDAGGLEVDGR